MLQMVWRGPACAAPGGHGALEDGTVAGLDGGRRVGRRDGRFRNGPVRVGAIVAQWFTTVALDADVSGLLLLGADGGAHISQPCGGETIRKSIAFLRCLLAPDAYYFSLLAVYYGCCNDVIRIEYSIKSDTANSYHSRKHIRPLASRRVTSAYSLMMLLAPGGDNGISISASMAGRK